MKTVFTSSRCQTASNVSANVKRGNVRANAMVIQTSEGNVTVPRSLNGRKDGRKPIDADTYYEEMLKQVEREKGQLREALQQVQDSQAPQLPVAGLLVSAGLSLGIAVTSAMNVVTKTSEPDLNRGFPPLSGQTTTAPPAAVSAPPAAIPAPPPKEEKPAVPVPPIQLVDKGLRLNGGVCEIGKEQSPIDITFDKVKGFAGPAQPLKFDMRYNASPGSIKLTDDGPRVFMGGNTATIDGVNYDLLQYHFHSPSEHRINGALYDAEVHLVHKEQGGQGRLAVVGIFLKGDKYTPDNPALQFMLDKVHDVKKAGKTAGQFTDNVDPRYLLPATANPQAYPVFKYAGSLTTIPCSEGVAWHVLQEPIKVSSAQILELLKENGETKENRFFFDNREVMPLNDRTITALNGAKPAKL